MPVSVQIDTYDAANSFTQQHWPAHNADTGVVWTEKAFGLLAREDDEVLGAATVKVIGGAAYLEQLVVAHGGTRRGVGTRLMQAFEAEARRLGCHVLELETAEYQARGFYEKQGFDVTCVKERSKFRATWYFMQKRL